MDQFSIKAKQYWRLSPKKSSRQRNRYLKELLDVAAQEEFVHNFEYVIQSYTWKNIPLCIAICPLPFGLVRSEPIQLGPTTSANGIELHFGKVVELDNVDVDRVLDILLEETYKFSVLLPYITHSHGCHALSKLIRSKYNECEDNNGSHNNVDSIYLCQYYLKKRSLFQRPLQHWECRPVDWISEDI